MGGSPWLLAAQLEFSLQPHENRKSPAPALKDVVPQEVLNEYRIRAMSVSHYKMISGFINKSKGNKPTDLATNGTFFNNGSWHDLPAYKNKQSVAFLTVGEEDDQFLLMSNEVGDNIYANSPLSFDVYSVRDKEKISVNFTYNKENTYYLTAVPDYENPNIFYQNICNMEPDNYSCSTAESYVDRCEIDTENRTVTCSSIFEKGYLMSCPLQTKKGVRNLTIITEDNMIRMKRPFAPDREYDVKKGDYRGGKVPYFYPWFIGDECDGALLRRYYGILNLQRDPENPDIITDFSTISADDVITAIAKLSGENIRAEYSDISSFTKVGDNYEVLILHVPKGTLYTTELINVRVNAKEKDQLLSGKH